MPCPNCSAADSNVHPVWSDEADRQGSHADYIACESCRKLIDPNEFIHGQSDSIQQANLTDHEISRLTIGNQHSDAPSIIEWMTVKGAARKYEVTDWTSKVDSTLTWEENVGLMQNHSTTNDQRIRYVAAVEKANQRAHDDRRQQSDD